MMYVGVITDFGSAMIFVFKSRYLYVGYSGNPALRRPLISGSRPS